MHNTLSINEFSIPLVELSKQTIKTDSGLLYNVLDSIEQYYYAIDDDKKLQITQNFRLIAKQYDTIYNNNTLGFVDFCKIHITELGKLLIYEGKLIDISSTALLNFCKTYPIGSCHKTIEEIITLCKQENRYTT